MGWIKGRVDRGAVGSTRDRSVTRNIFGAGVLTRATWPGTESGGSLIFRIEELLEDRGTNN